ncbi:MAG: hypothetical protein ABII27_06440 [bacterium]
MKCGASVKLEIQDIAKDNESSDNIEINIDPEKEKDAHIKFPDPIELEEMGEDMPQEGIKNKTPKEREVQVEHPSYILVDAVKDDPFQDKGWGQWEIIKGKIYKQEVIKSPDEKSKFYKIFKDWIKKIDNVHCDEIMRRIGIQSVVEYPFYYVSLSTVHEKREDVKEFSRPYKGEKLFKKTVSIEENLDLWPYKSTDDIMFLKNLQKVDIPDSMEQIKCPTCLGKTVKCNSCSGKKIITCPDCRGMKRITCRACNSTKKRTCQECSGKGKTGSAECYQCKGTGSVPCEVCSNGYLQCEKCHSKGQVQCKNCNGVGFESCNICENSGKILQGLQFTSNFQISTQEAVFDNSAIPTRILQADKKIFTKDTNLAEVVGKNFNENDFLKGVAYEALKEKIKQFVNESHEEKDKALKIRRQKLSIKKYPIWLVRYLYENRAYDLYIKTNSYEIYYDRSPFQIIGKKMISEAKWEMLKLNFYKTAALCLRASAIADFAAVANRMLGNMKNTMIIVYNCSGILGGVIAGLFCMLHFSAIGKNNFNTLVPKLIFYIFVVIIGYVSGAATRRFVKMKLDKYKKRLLVPVLTAFFTVLVLYFGVFALSGFNPYIILDQRQFNKEFFKVFPFGIHPTYINEEYNNLKSIIEKYKKTGVDLSIAENGLAAQEKFKSKKK